MANNVVLPLNIIMTGEIEFIIHAKQNKKYQICLHKDKSFDKERKNKIGRMKRMNSQKINSLFSNIIISIVIVVLALELGNNFTIVNNETGLVMLVDCIDFCIVLYSLVLNNELL